MIKKHRKLKNDLTGRTLHHWNVLRYFGNETYLCRCKCGKEMPVTSGSLGNGRSKSCGCYKSPPDYEYNEKVKTRLLKNCTFMPSGCWDWIANIVPNGYGQTTYRRKTGQRAHRISWLVWKGNIPEGLWVLHKCDNRKCINPEHLFLGNHEENMKDMKLKNRACKGENSHLHASRRKK